MLIVRPRETNTVSFRSGRTAKRLIIVNQTAILTLGFSRYNGRLYDNCITLDNQGVPWCSYKLDEEGNDIGFHYSCSESCHVNNCPVGYYR